MLPHHELIRAIGAMTYGSSDDALQEWARSAPFGTHVVLQRPAGSLTPAFAVVRHLDDDHLLIAGLNPYSPHPLLVVLGHFATSTTAWGVWAPIVFVEAASKILREIRLLGRLRNPGLFIAGYSYGGGVAAVLAHAMMQGTSTYPKELVTFGSPKAGSAALAARLEPWKQTRYMMRGDVVPWLAPSIWHLTADELVLLLPLLPYKVNTVHTKNGVVLSYAGDRTQAVYPSLPPGGILAGVSRWIDEPGSEEAKNHFWSTYYEALRPKVQLPNKLTLSREFMVGTIPPPEPFMVGRGEPESERTMVVGIAQAEVLQLAPASPGTPFFRVPALGGAVRGSELDVRSGLRSVVTGQGMTVSVSSINRQIGQRIDVTPYRVPSAPARGPLKVSTKKRRRRRRRRG